MPVSGKVIVMRDLEKTYSFHFQSKTETLRTLLEELGCADLCQSVVLSPLVGGYRNRAKFKIFGDGKHRRMKGTDPALGEVAFEDSLWILPEWGRAIVRSVDDCLGRDSVGRPVDGFELQLTHGRQEGHLTLSVKPDSDGNYDELAQELLEDIKDLAGAAIPSKKKEYGKRFLRHCILGTDIFAHYTAFFQSNLLLTPRLVETVRSFFWGSRFRQFYDLYCGVGLFSLYLGKHAEEILGVDNSRQAVESAQMNAKSLGFSHAQFFCTSVDVYIGKFLGNQKIGANDGVLLNPPRSGVPSPVIDAVASLGGETICLVSCCLETHVRDLHLWQKAGYAVESMTAFDMFPFTDFLETATLLRRDK